MRPEYELDVCVDCLVWVANGDDTGMADEDRDRVVDAVAEFCADTGTHLVVGCDEDCSECSEFSHRRCDLCDGLAGTRHRVVGLAR